MFFKVLQTTLRSGYTDIISPCTENDSSLDYINEYIYHMYYPYIISLTQIRNYIV